MTTTKAGEDFLRRRALEAREAIGLSLKEAARLLGFQNYQTLSAIEKGKRNVNAHELSSMARIYGRSLDYFFEHEVPSDPIPLWRKKIVTSSDLKPIQREFLSFLENYTDMEALLELKRKWKDIQRNYDKQDFLVRGYELADHLGAETWRALSLGSRPGFNLLAVLENDLRVKVLHLPLPKESGVSGATVVDEALGVGILINANDVPWRRNFDLAHELFHVITWDVFTPDEVGDGTVKTKPEKYADTFASSLLLPRMHLLGAINEVTTSNEIRLVDIIELAKDFGVSIDAILWRLVNLEVLKKEYVKKVLDDQEVRKLDQARRKGLYDKKRPAKLPERYIFLACRCVMEGKISRGTFAK